MSYIDLTPIYEPGSDVLIEERICARPTVRGEQGTPYTQSDISSIALTLYLVQDGEPGIVPGFDGLAVVVADHIFNSLQPWDFDSLGYNFSYTIDADLLVGSGTYEAHFRFNFGSASHVVRREFLVNGPDAPPELPIRGWRGEWDSGEDYFVGDLVEHEGSTWRAADDNTNSEPPGYGEDPEANPDWELVAAAGAGGTAGSTGPAGAGYAGTSTSSVTLAEGPIAWQTQAGLAYSVGARVRVSASASPTNWAEGIVTGYSGTTLSVNVDLINGAGAFSAWNINLAGARGAVGIDWRDEWDGGSSYYANDIVTHGNTLYIALEDNSNSEPPSSDWGVVIDSSAPGADGTGYSATSVSNVTLATGGSSWQTQAGLAYTAGARARVSSSASPENWAEGVVTGYSGTTFSVNVDTINGSGAFSAWNINLAGEVGYRPTFDVKRAPYSAVGDGSTDDSSSIESALAAAKVFTDANANARALVWVPDGVFICEAVTVDGDRIVIDGPGTLKLKAASAEFAALIVDGDFCEVRGITIDGNASSSPTGRGECLRVNGNYNRIVGVYAKNTKTTGSTGSTFADNGTGNTYEGCWSLNSGYVGFRMAGDWAVVRDCWCLDAAVHGLTVAGGSRESLNIDGFYESSPNVINDGKSGVLIDAGSETNSGNKIGYMMNHVVLRNIRVNMAGGEYVGLKITRTHNLEIDGLDIRQGSAANSSVKIAEAIGRLSFKNAVVDRNIDQDPVGTATGSITDTESNGGFVKFTSTSHGVFSNDYIVIKGTTSYDGLHLVTAADTNTFTTNRKWVANDETGTYYQSSGSQHYENVKVGTDAWNIAGPFSGLRANRLSFKRCELYGFRDYAIGLDSVLSTSGIFERIEIDGLRLFTNDASASTVGPWVVAWNAGSGTQTGILQDSNVCRIRGVEVIDNGTGLTRGLVGNSEPVKTLTANATLSALDSGATFLIGAADLTLTLPSSPSVGPGVRFTFIMTSAGLSTGSGLAISPQSADYIAMSRVSAGVDNKDLQLSGANDAAGDCVTIVSDGSNGWYAVGPIGKWAIESDADVFGEADITLSNSTTTVGNVGTGEDDLISYSMPANTLVADGDSLRIRAGFTLAANGNTKAIKFYIGSNVLFSQSAAQNGGSYYVEVNVIRHNSTTIKYSANGGTYGGSGTPLTNVPGNVGSAVADTATALTIKATGEATSNNDIVQEFLQVQRIPAP